MSNSIFDTRNYFFNPHSLPCFISGVLIMAESIFVFFQNRKSPPHYTFAFATFSAGVWLTGIGFMYCSLYEPVASVWAKYYSWLGIIFITPGVYFFSTAWESAPSRKRIAFIYLIAAVGIIFYILSISTDYFIRGAWHYSWGFYPKGGILEAPFLIWFCVLMILSFRNFIRIHKKEQILIRKKQTKLIIIAFTFGFIGIWDFAGNFGIPLYPIGGPFAMAFSTVMGYAIVNYKLMEIETAIHKTIAWFFTSAALVAPLAALFYFSRAWYAKLNPLGMWGYFGAVLLCFMFFIKEFQPKIDNFFQKGKVYLDAVLNKFTEELIHIRNLEDVINKIANTIRDAIYVNSVVILLYNEKAKKLVAVSAPTNSIKANIEIDSEDSFLKWLSKNDRILNCKFIEIDPRYELIRAQAEAYFKNLEADICIPLILNEKLIGTINLPQKANFKHFTALDYQFLARLKNQSTIAISNSLVYDRVEELVKIRTEELVLAQKQLVQAEKLATVGTLAGGVAHEINNPLAAILANAQMMLISAQNKDDKESLQLIEEAAKRCRNIVQKLMVYSRKPLTGREVAKVDLNDALNNVNSFLGYQLTQENIKVDIKSQNAPFMAEGCQNELEQVFINLFLNSKDAIKKIKKSGVINVSISKTKDKIIIKIKDEGCGIPKENISKIFDPFFTTKDVGKGTGLGLSICQGIIEQHKGAISVDSQEGFGATFTVILPAANSLSNC